MATSDDLRDRHVVVTGGTGALGSAVVEALRASGAICHLPVRKAGTDATPGVLVTAGIDVADEGAVTRYYAGLPPLWASVHLAGGFAGAPLLESSLALLRAQLDVNLVTAFLCSREAVRAMRRTAGAGRIVNVASRLAVSPAGGALAYAAAKAAVAAFSSSLAAEVRDDGIVVNTIAPSVIDTPANRAAMPKADFSRWASPAAVAEVIRWLISPLNTLVSGAVVPVYGRA
jgi:NAD(P)-dependent dehydrogenase (short-subunit alcohol dehydrogenase family)